MTVVHVAAASDLRQALQALIRRYRAEAPGVTVVPTFGASGQLAEQIRAGAPFALFLAANEGFVRGLAEEGLIDLDSIRPYAIGSLTLVVSRDAGAPVKSLADLAGPSVKKVAIANPETAPYGAAARQALRRAGLWDTLGPRLVIAESVRQALQFVQTGNAEAGLVGRAISDVPEVSAVAVDPALYDPIVQSLGIVSKAPRTAEARAFARFVLGPLGRETLVTHGLNPPSGP